MATTFEGHERFGHAFTNPSLRQRRAALDISEYEALWLDAMRERMVDRFQAHDDDGDGSVTIEDYTEEFVNLVKRRDRNDDGVLNADDVKRPSKKGPGPENR